MQMPPRAAMSSEAVRMRSLSFTRNSRAPEMRLSPSANAQSSATRGSSSIIAGTSSAVSTIPCMGDFSTRTSPVSSPPETRLFSTE